MQLLMRLYNALYGTLQCIINAFKLILYCIIHKGHKCWLSPKYYCMRQLQNHSLTPSVAVTVKSKLSDPSSRSRATLVQICPVSLLMVNWLSGALAGPDPIEYVMAPKDPASASSAFTCGADTQRTVSELWSTDIINPHLQREHEDQIQRS